MIRTILKVLMTLVPGPVKNKIKQELRYQLRGKRPSGLPDMLPKIQDIHVNAAKILVDRSQLIAALPKGGIIAEIGVAEGRFSAEILKLSEAQKFHLIDAWNSERYGPGMLTEVKNKFREEIDKGRMQIHQGLSTQVGQSFPNAYFDWIYLDTDHSYQLTRAELELYSTKVKKDGIIAGHDFTSGNFETGLRYGVIEAVLEFCARHNWRMIFLTIDQGEHPSFAIQRIPSSSNKKG